MPTVLEVSADDSYITGTLITPPPNTSQYKEKTHFTIRASTLSRMLETLHNPHKKGAGVTEGEIGLCKGYNSIGPVGLHVDREASLVETGYNSETHEVHFKWMGMPVVGKVPEGITL